MPRATTKKPTGAELGADALAKASETPVLAADKPVIDERAFLAQFAVGLLRDNTGRIDSTDVALRQRVRDAFARAQVMLDEFKTIIGA